MNVKFRIWSSSEQRLVYYDPTRVTFSNEVLQQEVMLCSGLRDCAGREVYAGDILLLDSGYHLVEYRDGAFRAGQLLLCEALATAGGVAGNRYRHQQLLVSR